jgi:hypothetical protein
VEAELAALASSGATTLVGLMATDAWTQVRDRVAALFGRAGDAGDADAAAEELRHSQEDLLTARAEGDEAAVAEDIEAVWRSRLRRVLRADPAAADELRRLLDELTPAAGAPHVVVTNTVNGGVHHGPVVLGQNFTDLTFHAAGTAYAAGTAHPDATAHPDPDRNPNAAAHPGVDGDPDADGNPV